MDLEVEVVAEIKDRYYSMPEIMQYLGVSRDSVLRWIATKENAGTQGR